MRNQDKIVIGAAAAALLAGCGGEGPNGGNSGTPPPNGSTQAAAINSTDLIVGNATQNGITHGVVFLTKGNAAPAQYTVTDLASVSNATITLVNGINSKGDATGFTIGGALSGHAFLYRSGAQSLVDCGNLPNLNSTNGRAINDSDEIVGESAFSTNSHPFLWDPVLGIHYIPDPSAGSTSGLTAINDNGLLVGTWSDGVTENIPFTSTLAGPPVDLSGEVPSGYPHAVNQAGVIVGDGLVGGGWTYDTVSKTYTALSGTPMSALAINAPGHCVGSIQVGANTHAALWVGNQVTDLGTLGQPSVVDLNRLVPAGTFKVNGDYIATATGINDDGVICCNTKDNHALILTPAGRGRRK